MQEITNTFLCAHCGMTINCTTGNCNNSQCILYLHRYRSSEPYILCSTCLSPKFIGITNNKWNFQICSNPKCPSFYVVKKGIGIYIHKYNKLNYFSITGENRILCYFFMFCNSDPTIHEIKSNLFLKHLYKIAEYNQ